MYVLQVRVAQDYHEDKTGNFIHGQELCKSLPGNSTDANKQHYLSRWAHGEEMTRLGAADIVALSKALDCPKHILMGCKYSADPCCKAKALTIFQEVLIAEEQLNSFLAGAVSICDKYQVGPDLLFVDEKSSGSCNCKTDES